MLVSTPRPDSAIFSIPRKGKELAADRKGEEALIKPKLSCIGIPKSAPSHTHCSNRSGACWHPRPRGCALRGCSSSSGTRYLDRREWRGPGPLTAAGSGHRSSEVGSAGKAPTGNGLLTEQGPAVPQAPPSHQAAHGPPTLMLPVCLGVHHPPE